MAGFRTIRRTAKIWRQIQEALYPFKDTGVVRFASGGKIQKLGKPWGPNFYEAVLLQLPQNMTRQFVYFCETGPEPTEKEFAKWRRLLLGTARRTLYREQVRRIKDLPHLPGRGRAGASDEECNQIRKEFDVLRKENTATEAVRVVASRHGYKERNVWKILRRTRRS